MCASRVLLSGATRASVPVRRRAAWPDQGSLWREASLGAREPLAQLRQFFVEEPRRFFVDRCEPINPGDRDRAVCDERRDCALVAGCACLDLMDADVHTSAIAPSHGALLQDPDGKKGTPRHTKHEPQQHDMFFNPIIKPQFRFPCRRGGARAQHVGGLVPRPPH